jgi:hypothetical protein
MVEERDTKIRAKGSKKPDSGKATGAPIDLALNTSLKGKENR